MEVAALCRKAGRMGYHRHWHATIIGWDHFCYIARPCRPARDVVGLDTGAEKRFLGAASLYPLQEIASELDHAFAQALTQTTANRLDCLATAFTDGALDLSFDFQTIGLVRRLAASPYPKNATICLSVKRLITRSGNRFSIGT